MKLSINVNDGLTFYEMEAKWEKDDIIFCIGYINHFNLL